MFFSANISFFLCDYSETSVKFVDFAKTKILLGWSAKDHEILQAKNIVFRLQHTKFD